MVILNPLAALLARMKVEAPEAYERLMAIINGEVRK